MPHTGPLTEHHVASLADTICRDSQGHRYFSPGTATLPEDRAHALLSKKVIRQHAIARSRLAGVAFDEHRQAKGLVILPAPNARVRTLAVYLAPELRGGGIAENLVREAVSSAFADPRLRRIESCYDRKNPSSAKLHERLGFAPPQGKQHWKQRYGRWLSKKVFGIDYVPVNLDRAGWQAQAHTEPNVASLFASV